MRAVKTSKLIVLWMASFAVSGAFAQEAALELKGLKPGDVMEVCPPDSRIVPTRSAETLCGMGPTTLANQEASDHLVSFHNGRVVAVMYQLRARGQHANAPVKAAFVEKYGPPTLSKPHINDFAWERQGVILSLDGWKGTVVLIDRSLAEAAQKASAQRSKGDI